MTKEELDKLLSDIGGFTNKIADEIIKEDKLPSDYYLSRDDIIHEVNLAFVSIAQTYKPKTDGVSLHTYCYRYGKKTAIRNIWRTYDEIKDKLATIPIEEVDEEIHHQYGRYDFTPRKKLVEALEESDAIENLRKMADETDRRIIDLLIQGYSKREIESRIGLSHQAISKRMRRLAERFHDWENTPLGKSQGV